MLEIRKCVFLDDSIRRAVHTKGFLILDLSGEELISAGNDPVEW